MIALQTLYEYDTVQHLPEEILQRHTEDRHLQPKVVEYARELVMGVCDHLAEIDAHIQSADTFRARHRNGHYNKWLALIKIF
jgi:N utilization substance protein B